MSTECLGVIPGTFIACGEGGQYCSDECLRAAEKVLDGRFVIRPDIDPNDEKAVKELAGDIAGWIVKQRDRIKK